MAYYRIGKCKDRLGHKFQVTGDRVPENIAGDQEQDLICTEVSHVIDHSGYHMDINAKRKFITNEGVIS